jgi:hypothetical protein
MIVVRYATLAALVIWLGALVSQRAGSLIAGGTTADVCGAAVLVGLFVLKFMGPPPRGFVVRAAIAVLMLAIAAGAAYAGRDAARLLVTVNIGLGFVLLIWYVRE